MALFEAARPAPFGAITIHKTVAAVANGFEAVTRWNNARVTRKALGQLTERELSDIGLSRGDIERMTF